MERRKDDRRHATHAPRPVVERRGTDRRRGERRKESAAPERIAPAADTAETLERLVSRRQLRVEEGDVVIAREPLPRLQSAATDAQWWFRVGVYPPGNSDERVFTSFHHAALHAEQLASQRAARLLFIEDRVPTLLNDYRH
jgi:hypothetical protein